MNGRIATITAALVTVFSAAPPLAAGRSDPMMMERSFIWKLYRLWSVVM